MQKILVPNWVKKACFYEIFPDRYAKNIKHTFNNLNLEDWDSPPSEKGFKGGNLKGIAEHIDYLLKLGINAIYFTPIFSSTANHRYHTYDYFNIDPVLGTNNDFKILLDLLIKIILK